jgi:hypothetical protein
MNYVKLILIIVGFLGVLHCMKRAGIDEFDNPLPHLHHDAKHIHPEPNTTDDTNQ